MIAISIPRSLRRFLVTGTLTVALDAAVYALLLHLSIQANVAKATSLIAATLFAYVVNRFWAFSDSRLHSERLIPFLVLYASAILLNVAVNGAGLAMLGHWHYAYGASWLLATASSSTWNYLGMRHIVFPARIS